MPIIVIMSVLIFGTALCAYEIPKMLKSKSYKELWVFCILFLTGFILVILRCLNITIPNPSDLIAWAFSPISEFVKNYLDY